VELELSQDQLLELATTGEVTAWNPSVLGDLFDLTGGLLSFAGVRALAVAGQIVYVGADYDPELRSPGFIAVDAVTGLLAQPATSHRHQR
jgi:hypothetical protein